MLALCSDDQSLSPMLQSPPWWHFKPPGHTVAMEDEDDAMMMVGRMRRSVDVIVARRRGDGIMIG